MYLGLFHKQKGVTLSDLLFWSVVIVIVLVLGMKVVPAYIEHGMIQDTLKEMSNDPSLHGAPPSEIHQSFRKRASINDIQAIRAKDLKISQVRGQLVITSDYSVTIPLLANVSLVIDFKASSND